MAKGQMPEGLAKYLEDKKAGAVFSPMKSPLPLEESEGSTKVKVPQVKKSTAIKPKPYDTTTPTQVGRRSMGKD